MDNIPELSYLTKLGEELLQLFNKKEDHVYGKVSSGGTEKGNRFIVTELEEFKEIETIPNSISKNLSPVRNPRSVSLCIFSTPLTFSLHVLKNRPLQQKQACFSNPKESPVGYTFPPLSNRL